MGNVFELKRPKCLNLPLEEQKRKWYVEFLKTFSVIFLAYFVNYLIRQNMNAAQVQMIGKFGVTRKQISSMLLSYSVAHGIGRTVLGFLVDKKNTKRILSFLVMLGGIFNMILGIVLLNTVNVQIVKWSVCVLWGLNGFVLAPGSGCSYSTIIRWLPKSKQATWIGHWNGASTLGGAFAATLASLIAHKWFGGNPGGFFLVPGLIATSIGFWGIFFGADDPLELGWNDAATVFGEAEKKKEEENKKKKGMNTSSSQSRWSSLVNNILKNPWILVLSCANIFVYVIRLGVSTWVIQYANVVLGHAFMRSTWLLFVFEIAATVGGSCFGWLSDLMGGRRMLLSSILMLVTTLGVYLYSHATSITALCVAMGICGFFIYGPHLLIGVSAAKFVPREAVAIAKGVTGTFAYLLGDSLLAKYVLPVFVIGTKDTRKDWEKMFIVMYAAAVVGAVLMLVVAWGEEMRIRVDLQANNEHEKKQEMKEENEKKKEKKGGSECEEKGNVKVNRSESKGVKKKEVGRKQRKKKGRSEEKG